MSENRVKVGVGVIIVKDGKVLLGRRKRKGVHGELNWSFSGGHFEFNESIEDCARREALEETGIKIKNVKLGPYTDDIFKEEGKHYLTIYVIADYDSGYVEGYESSSMKDLKWFDWNDLPEPLFLPLQNLLKQGFSPFGGKDEN